MHVALLEMQKSSGPHEKYPLLKRRDFSMEASSLGVVEVRRDLETAVVACKRMRRIKVQKGRARESFML
jgi:hypothetical protein